MNKKSPDNSIDWSKVELEPMVQKTPEAISIKTSEQQDKMYRVQEIQSATPEVAKKLEVIRDSLREMEHQVEPSKVQEKSFSKTDFLNTVSSATHKREVAKKDLLEGGPFSNLGMGIMGTSVIGSALVSGFASTFVAGIAADLAAGATLSSIAGPIGIVAFPAVGALIAAGIGGYSLFKYLKAKRNENNLKKEASLGSTVSA